MGGRHQSLRCKLGGFWEGLKKGVVSSEGSVLAEGGLLSGCKLGINHF